MKRIFAILVCAASLYAAPKFTKVHTIAGTGQKGFSDTLLDNPFGVIIGPDGNVYFCEYFNHTIRKLNLKTGKTIVIAGTGKAGYTGDGGPAMSATFNQPHEIRFDKAGNMYVADMGNHAIRRIDAKTGNVSTVAGTGVAGFSGDGGPAAMAQLRQPHSVQLDPQGNLLICDVGNQRIRKVDVKTGIIDVFAGNGERKPTADGTAIKDSPLNGPRALDFDPQGNIYLALREGNQIFKLDPKKGTLHHIAGTGEKGYTGDGGPAKQAKLNGPKGVAWSRDGGIYIADTESHVIRRIDLKSGVITTVLGTGEKGDGPETDPLKCKLARPHGVFVDKKGKLYVGDSESHRVRVVE